MDLVLTTSQKLALSQRMLQSAEILQMSSQELVEYVQELAVENPVVECEENKEEQEKFDQLKRKLEWLDEADEQNKTYYKEEKEDESNNDMWNFKQNEGETLYDYLISQINVLSMDTDRLLTAHYIIECVNKNGYIEDSVEEMASCLGMPISLVEEMLAVVQGFEPEGVGARSLKECLLLQLKRLEKPCLLAEKIVENELETLAKNQLHIIAKHMKVSIDDVISARGIIRSLNPKPGNSFRSERNLEYITPDVIVIREKGEYEIVLNDYYFPRISINSYYKSIIKGKDSSVEDKEYVSGKIKQAEWAMKCISKRNTTLVKTLEIIICMQKAFFDYGPGHLKPLRLIDVAEQIEMHESTVSRAARDKYLQCSWGIFPLNYFFSSGVSAKTKDNNQDKITPESIKIKIKDIIEEENVKTPFSDREITERLNAMGIDISRRTVAKYRETMGILGASGRKGY